MRYIAPEGMTGVRPGIVDSSLKQISELACGRKEKEKQKKEGEAEGGEGIVKTTTSLVSSTHARQRVTVCFRCLVAMATGSSHLAGDKHFLSPHDGPAGSWRAGPGRWSVHFVVRLVQPD